jgi:L-ascorbate metabolism protein UlaG (beta-lactamase superfamily)
MYMNVKYLGHSCFFIKIDSLKILIDPFISGNPHIQTNPLSLDPDVILVTHDHQDHIGDTIDIAKYNNCDVICIFDLAQQLSSYKISVIGGNIGGTIKYKGLEITFVKADHSSTCGSCVGFVITTKEKTIYFAGDTGVFYDMKLIKELYNPEVVFLPIGDVSTMGPKQAAYAIKLLDPKVVVPMHYGTFDLLTGTPEQLKEIMISQKINAPLCVFHINESKDI